RAEPSNVDPMAPVNVLGSHPIAAPITVVRPRDRPAAYCYNKSESPDIRGAFVLNRLLYRLQPRSRYSSGATGTSVVGVLAVGDEVLPGAVEAVAGPAGVAALALAEGAVTEAAAAAGAGRARIGAGGASGTSAGAVVAAVDGAPAGA